jgi:hypothetical protein
LYTSQVLDCQVQSSQKAKLYQVLLADDESVSIHNMNAIIEWRIGEKKIADGNFRSSKVLLMM